jgi:hypothetical protein
LGGNGCVVVVGASVVVVGGSVVVVGASVVVVGSSVVVVTSVVAVVVEALSDEGAGRPDSVIGGGIVCAAADELCEHEESASAATGNMSSTDLGAARRFIAPAI